MRVIGEDDLLIDVCAPELLGRYLSAPNAEVKKRADGSIKCIRLRSFGDDRRHLGENWGQSTVTTERIRNDSGMLIASDLHLQHKATSSDWRTPAVKIRREIPR